MTCTQHIQFTCYRCRYVLSVFSMVVLLQIFCHQPAFSQVAQELDEISLTVNVQRIGSAEMPGIIRGTEAYLSVKDVFDFLKIRNATSQNMDTVSGYFINPKSPYIIDKASNKITYSEKVFNLDANGLIRTERSLYLKSAYFGEIFGLECNFNFRSLSVTITTKIELPAIREMQQEMMRRNINQLKGEKKADSIIKRSYPFFHLGMADWSVISSQDGQSPATTRLNLSVGTMLAGGEANFYLNYTAGQPMHLKQQFYHWRYVNNNNAALRQVTLGKIYTQSTSSLNAPINGIQITNTPTTYRRSLGTYTLSNTTEPGWTVELYVNNILVNYMKADASGFFSFEVPMVYGNSVVKLRFFGPWGEERIREQYISVPFNFLPSKQFEYTLSAGVVEDEWKSKFSRANFNYGVNRHITIGGGVEYFSTVMAGKPMPYVTTSLRLGSNLLVNGEHMYGVRTKGMLTYRLPSNVQLDVNYNKYDKMQTAVRYNYIEEKKAVLSVPFHAKKFSAFTRLTVNRLKLTKNNLTTAELLFSTIVKGVSSNFTTSAMYYAAGNPFIYSNLSLTFRLPGKIRFTPQVQYEYKQKNVSMIKGEIEKNVFKNGYLNASYERYKLSNNQFIGIGFRYNFSFGQTYFSARKSNTLFSTTQSARGSFIYDDKTNSLIANNQNNVGRGGLIISPFLDLNWNGKRDAGEPRAFGLKVNINGGRIKNVRDTTIRITGLEAYTNYHVDLNRNNFENVAWHLPKKSLSVCIEPNHFKLIDVPVTIVGEVSGTVYFKGVKGIAGMGRILVNFTNSDSVVVAKTLTESDGFFSFMGLAPGIYKAQIDPAQLEKLHMTSTPNLIFAIKQSIEGDAVEELKFTVEDILDKEGKG